MTKKGIYQLSEKEIITLIRNMRFTNHSKDRIIERIDAIDFDRKISLMKKLIREQAFAYMNNDGCINVAVTETTYIVAKPLDRCYLIVTYKEPSNNNYTVRDKYTFALMGVLRWKYHIKYENGLYLQYS